MGRSADPFILVNFERSEIRLSSLDVNQNYIMALHSLFESAGEIRLARSGKYVRCCETKPPEWMHDVKECRACVEQDLGVVY